MSEIWEWIDNTFNPDSPSGASHLLALIMCAIILFLLSSIAPCIGVCDCSLPGAGECCCPSDCCDPFWLVNGIYNLCIDIW